MLAIITFQFFKRNSLIIHAQFKIFIPEYSVKHVLFNELLKKNVREYAKKNAIFFVLNVNDSRVDRAVNNLSF